MAQAHSTDQALFHHVLSALARLATMPIRDKTPVPLIPPDSLRLALRRGYGDQHVYIVSSASTLTDMGTSSLRSDGKSG